MTKKLLPCKSCPWRVENDSADIPRYDHDLACRLQNTVGQGDGFRPIMACHNSKEEMFACNGYLAQEGFNNINVRLGISGKWIKNPNDVIAACKKHGVQLERDYATVLNKLSASHEKGIAV